MGKRAPLELKPLPPPRLEIINLIDVLITLIAFFMMTASFVETQRQLGVNLPQARRSEDVAAKVSRLCLEVAADEQIYWNGKPLPRNELDAVLGAQRPGTQLTIEADRECRYQAVVTILDQARAYGLQKIALAVRAPE